MNNDDNDPKGIPGLGERLKFFRTSAGYSAQGLAEAIQTQHDNSSITRQVIFNIENGRKNDLSITELVYIADGLRLPPLALLCDLSDPLRTIESGPFIHKTNYDVIEYFSPLDADIYINDTWGSLCEYTDLVTDMKENLRAFNQEKEILAHDAKKQVKRGISPRQRLTLMEESLCYMHSDLSTLRDDGKYVPEEYVDAIAEADLLYDALSAKYRD